MLWPYGHTCSRSIGVMMGIPTGFGARLTLEDTPSKQAPEIRLINFCPGLKNKLAGWQENTVDSPGAK